MTNSPEPTEPSRWSRYASAVESSSRRVGGGAADATRTLAGAVSTLYEQAVDRMLAGSERVTSAAEGQALLVASDDSAEALSDQVQRVVVLAVPILRAVARGARFTRVPWVLVGSTAVSTSLAVHTGVREVQVLGSLLAHRIEETTGEPADPVLVKKLTVELYLAPKRLPDLTDRRLRLRRLIRRWVFRGAIGRKTGNAATRALEAAEGLDVRPLVARWNEFGRPSSAPGLPDGTRGPDDAR